MRIVIQFFRLFSTGYTLFLVLLSSAFLMFSDRYYFRRNEMKKEARFSFVIGILTAVLGLALFIVGNMIGIA